MTLPTWITLSRLLLIPVFWLVTSANTPAQRHIGLGIFAIAAATDWVDGYLARRLNQESDLGKVLDPLTDKLLVLSPLLLLVQWGDVPAWGVFLILARELLLTAWRGQSSAGANPWGKAKTVTQIAAVVALLLPLPYAMVIFWLAVVLTLVSGVSYFWSGLGFDNSVQNSS
ncbi:MAG: CDP-diacylglycerol--glycerol-3-phosphate 3-phosphatidyltransferase [Oscillatoriales cyanobacterium SM2_2_1]|nr:CDP-diacylglycerol--glycerol-3-phosphate 3-phosphatidyltransferase [Oscillatoriales cyanobacterium SM2_2_1]